MRPELRQVMFDRPPPSAQRLGIELAVGRYYDARLIDPDKSLYELEDESGTLFSVSMYGRSLDNGGYWHLKEDADTISAMREREQ